MGAYAYVITNPVYGVGCPIGIFSDEDVARQVADELIYEALKSDFDNSEMKYLCDTQEYMDYSSLIEFDYFLLQNNSKEKYDFILKEFHCGSFIVSDAYDLLVEAYNDKKIDIPSRKFLNAFANKFMPDFFKIFKTPVIM